MIETWNRYAYVANNPLSYVDPLGLGQCDDKGNCTATGIACYDGMPSWSCLVYQGIQTVGGWENFVCSLGLCWNGNSSSGGGGGGGGQPQPAPAPPASKPPSKPSQPVRNCSASATQGFSSIVGGSVTTPLTVLGEAVGGAVGGPPGAFAGGIIGSMFGAGANVSYVPSTQSLYVGPTLVFGLGLSGGGGFTVSQVSVPAGQNANSIANGLSFSLTFQPTPITGSNVTKSPGSGPSVVGPAVGTRIPFAGSVSYNFCVVGCGCQ